jgi:hypothetical protein
MQCRASLLTGAGAEQHRAYDRSLSRFVSPVLLFGRFRVRATIRDARHSDLALGKRADSGRRAHHSRRRLSVL